MLYSIITLFLCGKSGGGKHAKQDSPRARLSRVCVRVSGHRKIIFAFSKKLIVYFLSLKADRIILHA
jgi:hypothetical protein